MLLVRMHDETKSILPLLPMLRRRLGIVPSISNVICSLYTPNLFLGTMNNNTNSSRLTIVYLPPVVMRTLGSGIRPEDAAATPTPPIPLLFDMLPRDSTVKDIPLYLFLGRQVI
jgi:hypothetical protein